MFKAPRFRLFRYIMQSFELCFQVLTINILEILRAINNITLNAILMVWDSIPRSVNAKCQIASRLYLMHYLLSWFR